MARSAAMPCVRDRLGRGVGGGARGGDLAGELRQIVLHRLELGDRPAELDAVERVLHRLRRGCVRARRPSAASAPRRRAAPPRPRSSPWRRPHRRPAWRRRTTPSSRGSPARLVPWLIASPSAATSATAGSPPSLREHRDVLGGAGERARGARGRCSLPSRRARYCRPRAPARSSSGRRARRSRPAPSSQPAISVSASGTGAANRPATRNTANPSSISAPAPPRFVGDPGQRQPGLLERVPQLLRPLALPRPR